MIRRLRLVVLSVLLVAAWSAPAAVARAQQPPSPAIDVTAALAPPRATIGDLVTLTVTARYGDDVIVDMDAPALDEVDVVSSGSPLAAPQPGGGETTTFTFVLQPFRVGAIDTGVLRLRWLRADGSTGAVEIAAPALTVTPVRRAEDAALRPLKPQATVTGAPPAWVRASPIAAAMLALLLLAVGLRRARRRGRRPAEGTTADTAPERAARAQLDGLVAMVPPRDGGYEAYYAGIALAVRQYLGERFRFNAHALTTSELERRMVSHGIDRWQARLAGGLLERCDAAIYAHRFPDPASADHDLTVAYEIVELSRPRAPREEPVAV